MFSFSEYLIYIGNKDAADMAVGSSIQPWISHLKKCISKLNANSTISKQIADQCNDGLDYYSNHFGLYIINNCIIDTANNYYCRLASQLSIHIKNSRKQIKIPFNYPLRDKTGSGVICSVRIIEEDQFGQAMQVLASTHESELGADDSMSSIIRTKIRKNISSLSWLQRGLELLGINITDIFTDKYHAELAWCISNSQKIVDYITSNSDFKKHPPLNNEYIGIFSQLIQVPRLEIITSSACCEKCRIIFSALRLYLNSQNIHVPIILYANKMYNGNIIYFEEHGSIYTTRH